MPSSLFLIQEGDFEVKVKVRLDCTGIGYENLKKGQIIKLKNELATKLISFGYVEGIKTKPESNKIKK